jgi:hypothetical protein
VEGIAGERGIETGDGERERRREGEREKGRKDSSRRSGQRLARDLLVTCPLQAIWAVTLVRRIR